MVRAAVLLALAIGAAIGACNLLDDDPPTNTCSADTDCFRAQGEVCNKQTHVCEPKSDAGVDAP
jgi:hypothetical protein